MKISKILALTTLATLLVHVYRENIEPEKKRILHTEIENGRDMINKVFAVSQFFFTTVKTITGRARVNKPTIQTIQGRASIKVREEEVV